MEGLLIILGIFLLITWIITPFAVLRLSSRVQKLEMIISSSDKKTVSLAKTTTSVLKESMEEKSHDFVQPNSNLSDKFFAWAKEDWLLKLGGLLLLLGFGWLTTYAFMNNWIGPMGRIGFGVLLGTLILILGTWRIQNQLHQGGVFLVVGSTTILLTVFAARHYYDFFTPATALGIMFLASAYVALVSVKFNNRALALASIILAGIAPLLTSSTTSDFTALFAYLLIIVLGTVWIVSVTNQREITAAALLLVTFYSIPHLMGSASSQTLLLFAYAFSAIFFVTNTVGIVRLRDTSLVPDMATAAGNGLFLLAWIVTKAPEEWRSLIISGWMIAFIAGAFLVFTMTKKREPLFVYAGVGIAMLAAATATQLSGAALNIAFTIEVGMISWISYQLIGDRSIAERLCFLFIGPIILSVQSLQSRSWLQGVLHEDFFVLLILSGTLMALGIIYLHTPRREEEVETHMTQALIVTGSLYGLAIIWLSLHALATSPNVAVMESLIIFTLIGLITYFFGRTKNKKGLNLYGGSLLGLVVARLLLVDIWDMPLSSRVITFFVVGILLMSTAFFGRGKTSSHRS